MEVELVLPMIAFTLIVIEKDSFIVYLDAFSFALHGQGIHLCLTDYLTFKIFSQQNSLKKGRSLLFFTGNVLLLN